MGYASNFSVADALDSLSWVALPDSVRIRRLAARFLNEESKLRKLKEKGNWEVTAGILKPWLLSLYEPPRGTLSGTISALLVEIQRQREIRTQRYKNRPYAWPDQSVSDRRNGVAKCLYGITRKGADNKRYPIEHLNCTAIATVGDVLVAIDATYDTLCRVYMRHKPTGRVKVVVLNIRSGYDHKHYTLTKVLLKIAPLAVSRAIFGGSIVKLNFTQNGFDIDGKTLPWRNVVRIIDGADKAMTTRARYDAKNEPYIDSE